MILNDFVLENFDKDHYLDDDICMEHSKYGLIYLAIAFNEDDGASVDIEYVWTDDYTGDEKADFFRIKDREIYSFCDDITQDFLDDNDYKKPRIGYLMPVDWCNSNLDDCI